MAEAVVSVALEAVFNLVIEEARFLSGASDQVAELQSEFRVMKSFLKDADGRQHDDATVRSWIDEIKLLAYKTEDVLEEFVVQVESHKGKGFKKALKRFACIAGEVATLHKLRSEIQGIKSNIANLTTQLSRYGIQTTKGEEEIDKQRFIRQAYQHEEVEHFVGMEDDIKKLVSLLVSEESKRVIGIWAMGGSGKTTVARKVYKHVDVNRHFDLFAWVCISQDCRVKSVMQDIFRQLLPQRKEEIEKLGETETVEQIHQVLIEKKCLIVLDDIWKIEDWQCLSHCFPKAGSNSKVLLTTRQGNVAQIGFPYELKGLTEDEAWELLQRKAFATSDSGEACDNAKFEELGRTMIRKCRCLPLAVAVLGGILYGKNSLHEWELVGQDVNSYIARGEGTGERGEVEKVLVLSYNDLPYHLKPCFLSLGFLREDENFDVRRICYLWLAEGMVQSKHIIGQETMLDVAERYLYELHLRCMVQISNGECCRLHDLMLDLCRSKCKEEGFLEVTDNFHDSVNAHRLVVHLREEGYHLEALSGIRNINQLRSIQILPPDFKFFKSGKIELPQWNSLRTLVIEGVDFRGKGSIRIDNLIHLRLLCLILCELDKFPSSIAKLRFLQILDMSHTTLWMKTLSPVVFCNMQQLRHLYLPYLKGISMQRKLLLRGLSQLQSLYGLDSEFCSFTDLMDLKKLCILGYCWVSDIENTMKLMNYLNIFGSNLRNVHIRIKNCELNRRIPVWSDQVKKLLTLPINASLELNIFDNIELFELPQLEAPDFSKMSPGLVALELIQIKNIMEDPMQILGKFPNLRKLTLYDVDFQGKEMICDAGGFPRLQELHLIGLSGEFELRIDEAAMPNLSSMEIYNCPRMNLNIPDRLRPFVRVSI